MIGLSRRSSRSMPWRGSEAATGVPWALGVGVGIGVGANVPGTATGCGVGVGGGRVGRGVSRLAGFSEVGVGAGAEDTPELHAVASRIRREVSSRRDMPAARRCQKIYGTAMPPTPK